MNLNNEAVHHENERIKNRASEVEFSMAKMNEVLESVSFAERK